MANLGGWSDLARAVKERTDIVDLIGQRVKLRREGSSFVGLCPFHTERSPSFTVVPDRGFYHCFGCGKHGDVIEWVMQRDGIEFSTATLEMARHCGLEPDRYLGGTAKPLPRNDTNASILAVMAEIEAWTRNRLPGSPAMACLQERPGVDPGQAMERFGVGFAPGDGGLLISHLRSKGFTEEAMLASGAIAKSDDGRLYSFLRGRLTVPIRDGRGRTIALAGRALEPDAKPKWLNTRESAVFRKGETLFNLDIARANARDGIVFVEGYFDTIALVLNGIPNVVATMGTSVTEAHLAAAKKFSSRVVFAFDGDAAGMRACDKSVTMALPMGFDVRLYLLSPGDDPDMLVARMGGEKMKEMVASCPDWTNHTLARLMEGRNMRNLRDQADVIRGFSEFAPHIATREEKWSLVNTLSHRIGMPREDVMDILRRAISSHAQPQPEPEPMGAPSAAEPVSRPTFVDPLVEEMVMAFISGEPETPLADVPLSWWEGLSGSWIIQCHLDAMEAGAEPDPEAALAVRKIEAKTARLGVSPVPTARLLAKLELSNVDTETQSVMEAIEKARRSGDAGHADRLERRISDLMSRRSELQKKLRTVR